MKCKAAPEPERRRRPTINSALLLGALPGRGRPAGPRARAGVWPEAGLHSQPPCRGNGRGRRQRGAAGSTSPGLALPSASRCSHRWELPRGWASACGRGPREVAGSAGAPRGIPLSLEKGPALSSFSWPLAPGPVGSVQGKAQIWGRTRRGGDGRQPCRGGGSRSHPPPRSRPGPFCRHCQKRGPGTSGQNPVPTVPRTARGSWCPQALRQPRGNRQVKPPTPTSAPPLPGRGALLSPQSLHRVCCPA